MTNTGDEAKIVTRKIGCASEGALALRFSHASSGNDKLIEQR